MSNPNNMTELRNINPVALGDVAYLKGYSGAGDGGAGYFIFIAKTLLGLHDADNDGTVIVSNYNSNGFWVRQYDGYINVAFFGVTGVAQPDTQKIQNAIDFAARNVKSPGTPLRGNVVYFPTGASEIDTLTLRNGVTLLGGSPEHGYTLSSKVGSTGNMITIEPGVVSCNIENLIFTGNNHNRGCLYFVGTLIPGETSAGLRDCTFKSLQIRGFMQNGITLQGTHSGQDDLAHQGLVFENVRVRRANNVFALLLTGENRQMTFLNCTFDGYRNEVGDPPLYTFPEGANALLHQVNGKFPTGISFINCTSQDATYGISVSAGQSITFDNCWFESLKNGITVGYNELGIISKSINILNSRFANVGGFGTLNVPDDKKYGYAIELVDTQATVANNFVTNFRSPTATQRSLFLLTSGKQGVEISGNSFQSEAAGETFGIIPDIPISLNLPNIPSVLDCKHNKAVYVSNSNPVSNPIRVISSTLNAAETLTIRANAGDIYFANDHNIVYAPTASTLKLKNGGTAVFCRVDRDNNGYRSFFLLTRIIE